MNQITLSKILAVQLLSILKNVVGNLTSVAAVMKILIKRFVIKVEVLKLMIIKKLMKMGFLYP
jgi:hypothetical protein